MTINSIFKKALVSACYAFTAIILFYSLLVICFMDGMGMEPWSVLLFFPLSFSFCFANGIVKSAQLNNGTKLITHFITVTLSLVLFVYIPRRGMLSAGTALIVFTVYLIIYTVCTAVYCVRNSKKKKKNDRNSEYKKVY